MSQNVPSDLPEGVVNADPAGGWESAASVDGETRERSDAEVAEAGMPSDTPTGHAAEAAEDIESAEVTQGLDPDLATDDDRDDDEEQTS